MNEVFVYNVSEKNVTSVSPYIDYQPQEVGTFAITDAGDFAHCDEAIHANLNEIKVPADLNEGYDPKIKIHNETISNFPAWEKVLNWICATGGGYDVTAEVDVIAQRGVLKDIGYTLYDQRYKKQWILEACKFDGKVYLRFEDNEKAPVREWHHKNLYWGKRFEDILLKKVPGVRGTYNVIRGVIGDTRVMISAEVDAQSEKGELIEVKTTFKSMRLKNLGFHWIQCYLGTIELLCYGYKNQEKKGILEKLSTEKISDMVGPGESQLPKDKANAMFGMLADVLSWIRTVIQEGNTVWTIAYDGGLPNGHITMYKKEPETEFLPAWYQEFVTRNIPVKHGRKNPHDELTQQLQRITLDQTSITQARHHRCLFLTDSVLSSAPPEIFSERIKNFTFEKKVKKYCTDFVQFQKEFGLCDFIIISGGANDLQCDKKTAYQLKQSFCLWLQNVCKKYKETSFIFLSVLHTYYPEINREIDTFNRIMFQLSDHVPNLRFFDSHSVLLDDPITHHPYLSGVLMGVRGSESVKITVGAAKLITYHLINAMELECCSITGRYIPSHLIHWTWPIRDNFLSNYYRHNY